MKSHLAIIANGKPLTLPEDFSIDIDFQNPMFNDTEMFSYPVQIPTEGNRRLLKNIEDVNSDMRAVELEHTDTTIIVDGQPFCQGTMVMQDGEEITDSISMSVDEADQSFSDLISDLTCQDIPVKDKIPIGEKIGNLYVKVGIQSSVTTIKNKSKDKNKKKTFGTVSPRYMDNVFEPQALGFSYPAKCKVKEDEGVVQNPIQEACESTTINYKNNNKVIKPEVVKSYINVSDPYSSTTQYCNARVCYAHYALADDGTTSDEKEKDLPTAKDMALGSEPENRGAYWLLDADRPQSGICFYVLYFLDCLFNYLNVDFDNSALLEIEDFKHLCFFTTHCKYDTEVLHHGGRYKINEVTQINATGPYYIKDTLTLIDGQYTEDSVTSKSISVTFRNVRRVSGNYYYTDTLTENADGTYSVNAGSVVATDLPYQTDVQDVIEYWHYFFEHESSNGKNTDALFTDINKWLSSRGCGGKLSIPSLKDKSVQDLTYTKMIGPSPVGQYHVTVGVDVDSITISSKLTYAKVGANIMQMYANSENFPAESVSTLISSLENAFGIKFNYDYQKRKVTAYLIRNVFRKAGEPLELKGKVCSMHKMSEKITGVRMCYGSESDSKEQRDNVRKGTKDYDTAFDYIQYPDPETAPLGQTSTVYDKTYEDFYTELSNSDMNVYIDKTTGNAYRIKIDSEYTDAASMKPVLFEVGQWKGMEYGDCSDINEDFIQEFSIGFTPISFNDVNYKFECSSNETYEGVDEDTGDKYRVFGFNGTTFQPMLAAFVDEEMQHEFVEQRIDNALSCAVCDVLVRETLKLVENYDTTGTDDGNSPLQTYDWGMAIALMRGGGTDMTSTQYDYNYDGFGNSKWQTVVGQYALCSDTMDAWGNVYDYNGKSPGLGGTNGTYNGTYSKDEAKLMLQKIFYRSNANNTISTRKVSGTAAKSKGYNVNESDFCTHICGCAGFDGPSGTTLQYLYTVIQDDGTILTPSEVTAYLNSLENDSVSTGKQIMDLDAERKRIIIEQYEYTTSGIHESEYYSQILHQFAAIYYGDDESGVVSCTVPNDVYVAYGSNPMECFSLKINADKTWLADWAIKRGISLCNDDVKDEQGNVTTKIKSRGLWQTFMIDYGYFLVNRKKYIVRGLFETAQIADIKNHWKEWWTIDGKRCLINKVSCSVSAKDGMGECELEVYSL